MKNVRYRFWAACLLTTVLAAGMLSACASGSQTQTAAETSQEETQPDAGEEAQLWWDTSEINSLGAEEWQWRYLDDPGRLSALDGTDWLQAGYDDSDWMEGKGAFGALDGKLQKVADGCTPDVCLRQYLPDGKDLPAYCFRAVFNVDSTEESNEYRISLVYDDAVIVYLNGSPVYYGNMPDSGYKSLNSYGCKTVVDDPAVGSVMLSGQDLKEGINVLAVELHQDNESSSDIFFRMAEFTDMAEQARQIRNETVCLGIGGSESERLVTWQGIGDTGYVEVAKAEDGGQEFPKDSQICQAQPAYENDWGTVTFRAVMTGLVPGEDYVYRVTDVETSDTYSFSVPEEGDFSFILSGDPQIASPDSEGPIDIYEKLIDYAMEGKKPDFILTLGDQSDKADDEELFLRYLSTDLSHQVPIAAIVGNHERASDVFSRFFYMPNMETEPSGDAGDMSGDYWFGWNNMLVLCMNSNNGDIEDHEAFLKEAKSRYQELYGEPDWTIAAFHHSIFSAGNHALDDSIQRRREEYVPMFEELGVDLVFTGHDHAYVRTYLMDGDRSTGDASQELTDPKGIVYFTLSSSTGTKYYDLYDGGFDYTAVAVQDYEPCMTRADVTDDTFAVTTYHMEENGTIDVLDKLQITKTE